MSNKRKVIVTLISIVMLSAIFLVVYYSKNYKGEGASLNPEPSRKFDEEGKKNSEDYAKVTSIEKLAECEKLSSDANIRVCIMKLVGKSDDCQLLYNNNNKEMCSNFFALRDAINTKKPTSCYDLATSSMSGCIDSISFDLEKEDSCNDFQEVEKSRCYDIFKYKNAIAGNALDNCNSIKNEVLKNDCIVTIENKPIDSDSDRLVDYMELSFGTDPFKVDSDGDSLSDGYEIYNTHTNPLIMDTDNDELADGDEVNVYKTDPNKKDTDGDGYRDGPEVKGGYNPIGEGSLNR